MATNEPSDFDPRFDPAFQRGFSGADAPSRLISRVPAPAVAAPQVGLPPAAPVPAAVPVDDRLSSDADVAADVDEPARFNPFIAVLGAVSLLLVAGGIWGVQTAREPFLQTDAAAQADYVGLQMLMTASPLAIALGVATAIGILFYFAVTWRRAPR
jgi:hypothetical protein